MRLKGRVGIAFAILLALTPTGSIAQAPAPAGASEAPSSTTATYGDWLVRCTAQPSVPDGLCEVVQGIRVTDRQGLLAQIVFGRVNADDPLRLVVQLPLGIWLPGGATLFLEAEGGAGLQAPFTICANACLANIALPPALLGQLQAAPGPGRIEFVDGAQRRVVLPLSFKGLRAALAASGVD